MVLCRVFPNLQSPITRSLRTIDRRMGHTIKFLCRSSGRCFLQHSFLAIVEIRRNCGLINMLYNSHDSFYLGSQSPVQPEYKATDLRYVGHRLYYQSQEH